MPDDVVAYFCLNGDKLVLSVYTLTTLPVPPQNSVSLFQHSYCKVVLKSNAPHEQEPNLQRHPKLQTIGYLLRLCFHTIQWPWCLF